MRRQEPPIAAFRRRLLRLIEEQDAGQYTTLARRAGIPTTTMEHYIHNAKHLPGGEHLLKLAEALGVTAHYLATGDAAPLTGERAEPRIAPPPRRVPAEEVATHLSLPLFACGCPGPCPLLAEVPPVAASRGRVVVEADLLPQHQPHQLLAVLVTPELPCAEFPVGARLILAWDERIPAWDAVVLVQTAGRCVLGHAVSLEDHLYFVPEGGQVPQRLSPDSRVVGTVVAVVMRL